MMNNKSPRLFVFCQPYVLILCLVLVPVAKADTSNPDSQVDKLLGLIDQRLQLMQAVAAYKFTNSLKIENPEREARVLAGAIRGAQRQGLDSSFVEAFFRLQIQMAKIVQQGWFTYWQQTGSRPSFKGGIPDLSSQVRPQLIDLGEQILTQIPLALPALHENARFPQNLIRTEQTLTTRFVTSEMKQQLLHALISIHTQQSLKKMAGGNRLAEILSRGVLRVGTTGDYKPFSFMDSVTDKYTGVDIDLAKHLAESLGVELKLVPSSWPTLMADLAANQFDIGMSGISRTLLRQRSAFFSDAYSIGGKTPIARCDAVDGLNSLSKIDQPGIRVVVNPGGTNEKYVRSHIKKARIISYPDNTTIFGQILDKHADVMITDAIEVKVQEGIYPRLCGTMPDELLTRSEKGFLLPQDIFFKEYVNAWLRQVKQSGTLENYFSRHMGGL